jgi:hypothetical protein
MNETLSFVTDFCESLSSAQKNKLDSNATIIVAICTLAGTLATLIGAYLMKRPGVQRILPGLAEKPRRREEIRQSIGRVQELLERVSPAASELGNSNADDVLGQAENAGRAPQPPSPAKLRQKTQSPQRGASSSAL